ncbi:5'-3' exonuclease [Bacillus sp. JCM 19034]|uniref:5'-3' exonuclease n=1 Tax=Bacillus sp. JCM 19034 TaxID=1481928 RepID=UPI000783719B|nr:5'-3' exonuclease [Bacillus sp. JCM 19034]
MTNQHLMIVDGMALLFRSFYATAVNNYFMINSKGIPTNALFGLVKHLFAAKEHFNPTHIICCWDMEGQTHRSKIYPEYKANRGEAPLELLPQFSLAKELISALDIPNVGIKGYEADDCIGTIVDEISKDTKITVVTGDKDLLQLINDHTSVAIMKKGIGNYDVFTFDKFVQEYGIVPNQFSDVKALMGDSSDNYPGVKGIGEKTAIKLIKEFNSIDGLLENLDKLTNSQRNKIETDLENLDIAKRLAKIDSNVPINYELQQSELKIKKSKALEMFENLEFKGLDKIIS